jgi:hypothetical protein
MYDVKNIFARNNRKANDYRDRRDLRQRVAERMGRAGLKTADLGFETAY